MDENFIDMDGETVTLADDTGRTIDCTIERFLEVEGQEYALLLPIDSPIEIFKWEGEENSDDEEAIPVDDEDLINELFPIAKAVLGEQNLALKRTAVVLTVEGELPDLDEEEDDMLELVPEDDEDDVEELQFLASFYHQDQEYTIYAPLDPCFILARMDSNQTPHLLTPDELNQIQPMLAMIEDQLFDDMGSDS